MTRDTEMYKALITDNWVDNPLTWEEQRERIRQTGFTGAFHDNLINKIQSQLGGR